MSLCLQMVFLSEICLDRKDQLKKAIFFSFNILIFWLFSCVDWEGY